MAEERSVFERFGLPLPVNGERNEEGHITGTPPEEVREILKKINRVSEVTFSGKQVVNKAAADLLSESDIELLNSYAASLAGVADCPVRAIFGCWSCESRCTRPAAGIRWGGNLVETDCGTQCWTGGCGFEAC